MEHLEDPQHSRRVPKQSRHDKEPLLKDQGEGTG